MTAPVLLVHDDIATIASVRRLLSREGFEVILATSAADAIIAFGHYLPGLIVLAPSVEGGRGQVVLEELAQHPDRGLVRVLLLGESIPGFAAPVAPLPLDGRFFLELVEQVMRDGSDANAWVAVDHHDEQGASSSSDAGEPEPWRATHPPEVSSSGLESRLFGDVPQLEDADWELAAMSPDERATFGGETVRAQQTDAATAAALEQAHSEIEAEAMASLDTALERESYAAEDEELPPHARLHALVGDDEAVEVGTLEPDALSFDPNAPIEDATDPDWASQEVAEALALRRQLEERERERLDAELPGVGGSADARLTRSSPAVDEDDAAANLGVDRVDTQARRLEAESLARAEAEAARREAQRIAAEARTGSDAEADRGLFARRDPSSESQVLDEEDRAHAEAEAALREAERLAAEALTRADTEAYERDHENAVDAERDWQAEGLDWAQLDAPADGDTTERDLESPSAGEVPAVPVAVGTTAEHEGVAGLLRHEDDAVFVQGLVEEERLAEEERVRAEGGAALEAVGLAEEERIRAESDATVEAERLAEEEWVRAEDEVTLDAARLAEEERDRAEAEAAVEAERLAEEERVRAEAEAAVEAERLAEEEQVREEAEAAVEAERLAAEERVRAEAEAAVEAVRLAEEERVRAEAEAAVEAERLAEEELLRAEAEAEVEAERLAEEQRVLAEAEAAAEAARLAEEERVRAEAEAAVEAERLAEEERVRAEAEAAVEAERLAEEELVRAQAYAAVEAERLAEEERVRAEAEAAVEAERLAEEERVRAEAEAAVEAERQAEEERVRAEAEAAVEAERLAERERADAEASRLAAKAEELRLDRERQQDLERRIEEERARAREDFERRLKLLQEERELAEARALREAQAREQLESELQARIAAAEQERIAFEASARREMEERLASEASDRALQAKRAAEAEAEARRAEAREAELRAALEREAEARRNVEARLQESEHALAEAIAREQALIASEHDASVAATEAQRTAAQIKADTELQAEELRHASDVSIATLRAEVQKSAEFARLEREEREALQRQLEALQRTSDEAQARAEEALRVAEQERQLLSAEQHARAAAEAAAERAREDAQMLAVTLRPLELLGREALRVPLHGRLNTEALARLVCALAESRSEVRLDLRVDDAVRTLFFQRGALVGATSTLPHESLLDRARRDGLIDARQDSELRLLRAVGADELIHRLLARGYLREQEVVPLVQRFTEFVALEALSEPDSEYRISEDPPPPGVALAALPRNPVHLAFDALRRTFDPDLRFASLGGLGAIPELLKADIVDALPLGERERRMLSEIDGEATIETLLLASGLRQDTALQVLGALVGLSWLAVHPARVEVSVPAAELEVERLEAKFLAVQEADYFTVLGLARSAGSVEVERAFQQLSQQFDPLKFVGHPDAAVQHRARQVQEALIEAAGVLRDDRLRSSYARHLVD